MSLAFGLVLGVTGLAGGSSVLADRPTTIKKVTICHATGSESNPYIKIEVAQSAVDGNKAGGRGDHLNHTGPVWYPGAKAEGVKWGDIIPSIAGVTPGLNWLEGQATFDNDCEFVEPTAVTAAKAAPTTAAQTTTTAVLSGSETTTTAVLSSGGTVPGSEGLPKTGRDSSGVLLLGGAFLVFGAMLLGLTRKPVVG